MSDEAHVCIVQQLSEQLGLYYGHYSLQKTILSISYAMESKSFRVRSPGHLNDHVSQGDCFDIWYSTSTFCAS